MSYCLNPHCQKPQNQKNAQVCLTCNTKLLLKQRYRSIKVIGQGSFGRTLLTLDESKSDKFFCVIKQFLPQPQASNNIQKAAELFEQEAARLDKLGRHNQIPELLNYLIQDEHQYLVQEYIDGSNLAQVLQEIGKFNEQQIWELLNSLLPVLEYIHTQDVIHRDIKPQNIICDENGKVFLVDFGAVADTYHNTMTAGSTVVGTFGYMAPEQFRGKALPATDLYGLGTTLLYLLTQKHPADLPQKHLKIDFRSQIKVSRNFVNWLDKILEPDAEQRFPHAKLALAALQGKESVDSYLTHKPHKPKNTPISLRKSENELKIEIPPGKFSNNFMDVLVTFILLVHGLLLSTFLATILNISVINIIFNNFIPIIIFVTLAYLSFKFIISRNFLLHPLSRIKLDFYKYENNIDCHSEKW